MNPSATNLANITSSDYRAFLEREKQTYQQLGVETKTKQYHVLSNEQCASSSALAATAKTPPNMERANNTMHYKPFRANAKPR